MKYRSASIVCIVVLCFVATAAFAAGEQEGDERPFIGISLPNATHGWTGAVIDYALLAVEEFNIDARVVTADDVNKQANDLEDLIAQGVDAIVILPIEGSPLTPAAQSVLDADVPLVNFDRELDGQTWTALVKGDNSGIGLKRWSVARRATRRRRRCIHVVGPPVSVTTQRDDGFREAIRGTDIEVVGLQDGGYNRERGYMAKRPRSASVDSECLQSMTRWRWARCKPFVSRAVRTFATLPVPAQYRILRDDHGGGDH